MTDHIGIVGYGIVGKAICRAYETQLFPVHIIDNDPLYVFPTTDDDLLNCSAIFLCLPSPSLPDGSCDTSALEEWLAWITNLGYSGVLISKTTAPPSKYNELQKLYKNLVHCPEFLTAAESVLDYSEAEFAYIGGSVPAYWREAERIIRLGQKKLREVSFCTIGEAALAKYTINSFLATKVVFMNEIQKLAVASGCDFKRVTQMLVEDERIGFSHMKVPGPDGNYGYGGMCFPKDTSSLLKEAADLGVELVVLEAAVKKNTFLRVQGNG